MQKTAYGLRISDWSSDVCASDLLHDGGRRLTDLERPGDGFPRLPIDPDRDAPHGACVKARLLRNRKGGVDGSMVEAAAGIGLVAEIGHVEALAEAVSQRRAVERRAKVGAAQDRKSTRLNSSH